MVINSITLTTAAYTLDAKQYISDISRLSAFPCGVFRPSFRQSIASAAMATGHSAGASALRIHSSTLPPFLLA